MTRIQIASWLTLMIAGSGCSSMTYPAEADPAQSEQAPSAPVLIGFGYGVPEEDLGPTTDEVAQDWSELTRAARLDRQRGDFDGARDKLEQAAMQLADRPPANAERRAVLGMRSRLAMDFAALKRNEDTDLLADQLIAEVEQDPRVGGPAFIDLASFIATRRAAEAEEAGAPQSQLGLLVLALAASESETASDERMTLAFEVSEEAMREGDPDLARHAIDRAVLDAQTVAPLDLDQLASLKIFKARIALAQGDLTTAEASATSANRLFEEMNAPASNRAVAEATLARALAESGQIEKARAIGQGAEARLAGDPPVEDYSTRVVLSELARIERIAGNEQAARTHFEAALAVPSVDFEPDRRLVETLTQELSDLDASPTETPTSDANADAQEMP